MRFAADIPPTKHIPPNPPSRTEAEPNVVFPNLEPNVMFLNVKPNLVLLNVKPYVVFLDLEPHVIVLASAVPRQAITMKNEKPHQFLDIP